jgi:outer membrane protein assembly factor BamB
VTLTVTDANGMAATTPFTFMVRPSLYLRPASAPPTTPVEVDGSGFQANESVQINLDGQAWITATAGANGKFTSASTLLPPTLQPGSYPVSAVGQASGISVSETLTVAASWHFRNSAAGGSYNPHETTFSAANVAGLVPAPWLGYTGGAVNSSPATINHLIYVGSNDGYLHIWNPATYVHTRALPTNGPVGAIVSSPMLLGRTVYVGSEDGKLYGLPSVFFACIKVSRKPCVPSLKIPTGGPIESSPVAKGSTIFFGSDDGKLYAVNTTTKSVLWSTPLGAPVTSSPAVSGSTVVVGAGNNVYGLSIATGAVVWTGVTGGTVSSSPAVVSDVVYVGSQDAHLYAFPITCTGTCAPKWTVTTGGAIESSPAVANGEIYVGSDDGNLYDIHVSDHALQWTMTTGGAVKSSPAVANGVVYVGSGDGKLYAADAGGCGGLTSCSPLWTSPSTGGPINSSPDIANGQLYVGSADGHLYVYIPGGSGSSCDRFGDMC